MKTIKKVTKAELRIKAEKSAIFALISDHEGTDKWIEEVDYVKLLKEGNTSKNGKGAIREVKFKPKLWTTIKEEILTFEENTTYSYKIIGGMPGLVNHLGTWSLESVSKGETLVKWEVHFEFKRFHPFALFVSSFAKTFNSIQESALRSVGANCDSPLRG